MKALIQCETIFVITRRNEIFISLEVTISIEYTDLF